MLLQVTEVGTAMAAQAMLVVRATVEIAVAAAVEAKEVTTLAVARAVLSEAARRAWRARRSHCACVSAAPVQQRMRQCRNESVTREGWAHRAPNSLSDISIHTSAGGACADLCRVRRPKLAG